MDKEDEAVVVKGEFVTYAHVKTRKQFTITIEFPEEMALHVLGILGAPIADNSKPVAVCLLNPDIAIPITEMEDFPKTAFFPEAVIPATEKSTGHKSSAVVSKMENTEGKRILKWAHAVCAEKIFQQWCREGKCQTGEGLTAYTYQAVSGEGMIYTFCNIKSRSELTTNRDAQGRFLELMDKFQAWQIEQRYGDNLTR